MTNTRNVIATFTLNTYTLTLAAQPAHLFANGLDEGTLTATLTGDPGVILAGKLVTLTAPLGSVANPVVVLGSNGVGTTTYTAGIVPGTTPLTATFSELNTTRLVTATMTLKPNPLNGSLSAQFGGQIITYTFPVLLTCARRLHASVGGFN